MTVILSVAKNLPITVVETLLFAQGDRAGFALLPLNDLIRGLDFTILAIVILKQDHLNKYGTRARHPYHLSLEFIMERYSMVSVHVEAKKPGFSYRKTSLAA
ncbi:MAG: hypothetical protein KAW49_16405, partial [Anaerolineae bacterium]|nr:hypothetical protein [Anaerolineae bacterium]